MEKEDAGEEGVKDRELGPEEMIDLICLWLLLGLV